MDKPGRPSTASLATAPVASWQRLEPPDTLSPTQAALWREIVATKPAEWFKSDAAPVLEAYVRAIENARRTQIALDATDPTDITSYRIFADLAMKQANVIAQLATKLRLTPQSRYGARSAATADARTAPEIKKPWETR